MSQCREQYRADEYCRQQLRIAVQAAETMRPRQWLAKFGCLLPVPCSATGPDAGLPTAYTAARRQVEQLIPKQDGEQVVTYTAHI